MSDLPQPKFKIGQVVYLATTDRTIKKLACPDCLGSKVWIAKSPAGLEVELPCPRCQRGYFSSDTNMPSLDYPVVVPVVRALTIGSITAKTHPYNDREAVEYMCCETGIGSGSIYYEWRLHETAEAAKAASEFLASEAQSDLDARPESLKTVKFSSWTCDVAAYKLSWSSVYRAWDAARDYREIVDRIEENDGKVSPDDVEDLYAVREDKPWRDRHPLDALINAIGSKDLEAARAAYDALPKPAKMPAKAEEI